MPGGRAVSSRLSRSLTPLASRRSWTRSRTPQSTSPRSRKTWTSCTTRWTWRTPATVALTWRTTTASSAPPSRSSGGCGRHPGRGHGRLPSEPAVASRQEARWVVVGAGRQGSVRGSRPSGVWALGRGWTGGTDPEGALALRAFRLGRGEGRVQSAVSWGQPCRRPCPGRRGGWEVDPGGTSACPGAVHPAGSQGALEEVGGCGLAWGWGSVQV